MRKRKFPLAFYHNIIDFNRKRPTEAERSALRIAIAPRMIYLVTCAAFRVVPDPVFYATLPEISD